MNRKTIWAFALALSTVGAGLAVAEPGAHGGSGHGRGGHHGMEFMQALDLTDQQKASLKEMMAQQRETARPLVAQMREAHQALQSALDTGNADPARVGQLTLAEHQAKEALHAQHEQAMQQFATLLTPEQKAKFDQMQAERKQKREQWKQGHGQDGQPETR